jgi:hypothetical protein
VLTIWKTEAYVPRRDYKTSQMSADVQVWRFLVGRDCPEHGPADNAHLASAGLQSGERVWAYGWSARRGGRSAVEYLPPYAPELDLVE